jgi:hypothetical protein
MSRFYPCLYGQKYTLRVEGGSLKVPIGFRDSKLWGPQPES